MMIVYFIIFELNLNRCPLMLRLVLHFFGHQGTTVSLTGCQFAMFCGIAAGRARAYSVEIR